MANDLDAAELRRLLSYDPETGVFTWRVDVKAGKGMVCVKAGSVAGCFEPRGYHRISVKRTLHQGHRLAWIYMTGEWPKNLIDHINGNKSDNRFSNLREATNAENLSNRLADKTNSTGFKGVYPNKHRPGYSATITTNGKKHYLGYFQTPEEAHAAYCRAAIQLHGQFARTK
jgi:hypothetical protein